MISNKRTDAISYIRFFKCAPGIAIIPVVLMIVLLPFSAQAFDILLGTGETGTFSHFAGRMVCRVINSHADDLNCKVVPAPDDVDNLTNLQGGSLDIGLIDSRMLHDAINKTGYFEFLDISYANLRALVPLYDVPITLVVRGDARIAALDALKGKRINAGAPRSIQHLQLDTLLTAKNWQKADFSLITELPASQSQDTMAFCHGTVQAMLHIGVHPDASLQQLFKLCEANLVAMADNDIQKLVNGQPAFSLMDIPANVYPSQPERVTTFGTRAVLVAAEDLDEQTVYKIIDALYSNRKRLKSAHPSLEWMAPEADPGIQLHPGAAVFFKEKGL